ncbi:MAG: tetratricopeptide repeat protein [Deltaproteobacteria bacterium]|nr:tetratricopeptide repeat protein [Deltaproteobacteria bacterium]
MMVRQAHHVQKTLILAFCLLFTGCASMGRSPLQTAVADEMLEAKKMIRVGQYREAVDQLNMILQMNPNDEQAYFLRGVAHQSLEEFPAAVQDYETVIKKNPRSAKTYYNLGMIYAHKLDDPQRALVNLDRFLSLEPNHPQAGDTASLMMTLDERGQETSPEESQLKEHLSRLSSTENFLERRGKLAPLMQLYPDSAVLHYLMGQTYEREGRNDEAIRYYQSALELRPTDANTQQALGNLLIYEGKNAEGQGHLMKAKLFETPSSKG